MADTLALEICPNCKSFIGLEIGEEKRCSYCNTLIILAPVILEIGKVK